MIKPIYAIIDTETGGLDHRVNPLLSVALVIGGADFSDLDRYSLKVKPPPNTWLEIPVDADMFPPPEFRYRSRRIVGWHEVWTKATTTTKPEGGFILTAGAVEVNHLVGKTEQNTWDLEEVYKWLHREALDATTVDTALATAVDQASPTVKLTAVAHNADFDEKYVSEYLPKFRKRLAEPDKVTADAFAAAKIVGASSYARTGWYCTMNLLRSVNKDQQRKTGAKLADLAELAGYQADKAHEAEADCLTCLAGLKWLAPWLHELAKKHGVVK